MQKTCSGEVIVMWESLDLGVHQRPQPMVVHMYDGSHIIVLGQDKKLHDQECESHEMYQHEESHKLPETYPAQ